MKKAARDGDEVRRQGHPHPLLRPPRRQRDEPRRDATARVAFRSTRCAPTSSSAWPRPARSTASSASRSGSSRARSSHAQAPPADRRSLRQSESACSSPSEPSSARCRRATTAASRTAAPTSPSATSRMQAVEPGRLTARQIEAARMAITRHVKRAGKLWIRVFPDQPGHQEAARSPNGWRQGRRRGVGGRQSSRAACMYEICRRRREDGARGVPSRRRTSSRSATSSSCAGVRVIDEGQGSARAQRPKTSRELEKTLAEGRCSRTGSRTSRTGSTTRASINKTRRDLARVEDDPHRSGSAPSGCREERRRSR